MTERISSEMFSLVLFRWVLLLVVTTFGMSGAAWGLNVGEPAPDFTLPSTTGEKITLSAFRGKKMVLLEFYGADFSPV